MRTFKGFNQSANEPCPVCNTKDDKETVLIGVGGTEDGGNMVARQVHLECIDLTYIDSPTGISIFYQYIEDDEETDGEDQGQTKPN